ncbi:MAG: TspO/MBR family protein [Bacillota bacterium]|nr:TspO/MBR family protein [Bacillota bacterium]
MKKINWKLLIICIAIPLAVGGLSTHLTKDNMIMFEYIKKPPLSPPAWLFPVVWTILYTLMGIASYLVASSDAAPREIKGALIFYALQLVFNFLWSIVFFNLEAYLFAFIWLVLLWALILITAIKFFGINKCAGWLMVPYLLWVAFAGYLNYAIYRLN